MITLYIYQQLWSINLIVFSFKVSGNIGVLGISHFEVWCLEIKNMVIPRLVQTACCIKHFFFIACLVFYSFHSLYYKSGPRLNQKWSREFCSYFIFQLITDISPITIIALQKNPGIMHKEILKWLSGNIISQQILTWETW